MDWGAGHYETIARQLLASAAAVVDDADVRAGDRVLDLGCGTGNAAVIAAQRGAVVTGVDPAARLLEVGRQRVSELDLTVEFVTGEATAIPIADASVDIVLSVFGVTFAPDAPTAAAQIDRITAPGGRVAFSAWIPEGAMARAGRERATAIARAAGDGDRPPPFAWHDPAAVGNCSAVTASESTIASTSSPSPPSRRRRSWPRSSPTTRSGWRAARPSTRPGPGRRLSGV